MRLNMMDFSSKSRSKSNLESNGKNDISQKILAHQNSKTSLRRNLTKSIINQPPSVRLSEEPQSNMQHKTPQKGLKFIK